MGAQEASGAPDLHLIRSDSQPLPHLIECQHSFFTQTIPTLFQPVVFGDAGDHGAMEGLAITGRSPQLRMGVSAWPLTEAATGVFWWLLLESGHGARAVPV